jgi:hypothetical protein
MYKLKLDTRQVIPTLPVKKSLSAIGNLVLKTAMELKIENAEKVVPNEEELGNSIY